MPSLRVGQTEIPYELRRTATLSERRITVMPGNVEVLALSTDDEADIQGFLDRKRQWLFNTLREMEEALARRPAVPRFRSGSKIPFRGRQVGLMVRRHDGPHVEIGHRRGFLVDLPSWVADEAIDPVIASELRTWLKRTVRRDVHAMTGAYAGRFGLKARAVRVGAFTGGWGSCGPGGTIHIDWRLVFAPKRVLEYVVVHELAHLKERSHGEAFWALVTTLMPDWERAKAWLDVNQASLDDGFLNGR